MCRAADRINLSKYIPIWSSQQKLQFESYKDFADRGFKKQEAA